VRLDGGTVRGADGTDDGQAQAGAVPDAGPLLHPAERLEQRRDAQFIAESALLALLGGVAGALLGGFATTGYAHVRHWSAVVPGTSLAAAVAAALAVGAVAGVYPALRAARLSPAEALRSP
jgi:hypothetical protein